VTRRAALVVLTLLGACAGEGARPTAVVQSPDSADQVLTGFSNYVTRDGVRRSRVEADSAFFFDGPQTTALRKLKVTFFDDRGAPTSTLTAARGTYRWQTGAMDAEGNVVVTTADGRTLRTERLRYDDSARVVSTDVPFTFERGSETVRGQSLRSDPEFKNVVTSKPSGTSEKGILLPNE
jgi:LPS export ABC transporter protein LptC